MNGLLKWGITGVLLAAFILPAHAEKKKSRPVQKTKPGTSDLMELKIYNLDHTFKMEDGSRITGRLDSFSESEGIARVVLQGGSKRDVALSEFAEDERSFVQEWGHVLYLLDRKIRVTIDEDKGKSVNFNRDYGGSYGDLKHFARETSGFTGGSNQIECREIVYDITLENRSAEPLRNLVVQYCIYHEAELDGWFQTGRSKLEKGGYFDNGFGSYYVPDQMVFKAEGSREKREHICQDVIRGQKSFSDIPYREEVSLKTRTIPLLDDHEISKRANNSRAMWDVDTNLLGIRCRVYLPLSTGEYIMKEFVDPSNLIKKTKWGSFE